MTTWDAQLSEDLNWRTAELVSMKLVVANSHGGSIRQKALLRAIWAMLYAHYEGFCKFAWETYLDHIRASKALRKDCVESVAIFSLGESFKKLRSVESTKIWEFCTNNFADLLSQPVAFDIKLKANSNLWPKLCRANCSTVGLPHSAIDTHETRLGTLVDRRNDIAHGEQWAIASLQDYQPYENAAFDVMYELALSINDCLDNRSYLKPTPPPHKFTGTANARHLRRRPRRRR
jgi:hypothetical protein